MRPEEQTSGQGVGPLATQRSHINIPSENKTAYQKAATEILRHQINNIYDGIPSYTKPKASFEETKPSKQANANESQVDGDQLSKYHTAWQNYYQKYYEGYYTHHLHNAKNKLQEQLLNSKQEAEKDTKPQSKDQVLFELRQKLVEKVKASTQKIKKSRHFKPIIAGLIVIIILSFLQYNRFIISNILAYISPGNISPQNIIINPISDINVGPEPRLIIPKINVDVPVLYDVGNDYESQMKAMESGVAHFAIPGASSHPGQIGNTAIAGHSSNDLIGGGDYKFIFVQLDKLEPGDMIYANYNSKRYSYTVTKKEVVKPTEINRLVYPTTKPMLTLITCTPIGTAINRLLVTAEQVSPDPNQSMSAPTAESDNKLAKSSLPGNSPTLIERIFGSK